MMRDRIGTIRTETQVINIFRHNAKSWIAISLLALTSRVLADPTGTAADEIQLEAGGRSQELASWEQEYLIHAAERLYASCKSDISGATTDNTEKKPNELLIATTDGQQRLMQLVENGSNSGSALEVYVITDGSSQRLTHCNAGYMLPIASIIEARSVLEHSTETLPDHDSPVATSTTASPPEITRDTFGKSVGLTSYKPNRVGWTFDDNGVESGYLDAVISVKYPLFHDGRYHSIREGYNPNLYLAFTGRFSQYIETIESSPVVGKQFNPMIFSRIWLDSKLHYIDIGFAHESNGQSITTAEAYQAEREKYAQSDGDADFARNYISRGWDYVLLDWTYSWNLFPASLNTEAMFKYFLDDGPLQGKPEEYNEWENDGVHSRKEYAGISVISKYKFNKSMCLTRLARQLRSDWEIDVCLQEVSWQYTTGYDDVFDNSTNRAEFAIEFWGLPIMLWGQVGYNSDLVNYYVDVDSWGIALELESGQFLSR